MVVGKFVLVIAGMFGTISLVAVLGIAYPFFWLAEHLGLTFGWLFKIWMRGAETGYFRK
jgi:hypothetical protein